MSAARQTTRRTPRGQGDLLRDRLVDAALAIIDEQGDPSPVSIRAVTKRAGVSPTAFYLHFQQRDALLMACLQECFVEFRDTVRAATEDAVTPAERLQGAGLGYIAFAHAKPARYALIFGPHAVSPAGAPRDKPPAGEDAYGDLIERVRGYLGDDGSHDEAEVEEKAKGIWTGMHGFVTLRHSRPAIDWPSDEQFVESLARAWLGPPPGE